MFDRIDECREHAVYMRLDLRNDVGEWRERLENVGNLTLGVKSDVSKEPFPGVLGDMEVKQKAMALIENVRTGQL